MQCTACGYGNRAGRHFCAECGAKLALYCPACRAENGPGERFCGACGAGLRQGSGVGDRGPASPPEPRSLNPDPRNYTPKHLADKILTSRAALEGERKQVTVLFADVKGSMELAEPRLPACRVASPLRRSAATQGPSGFLNKGSAGCKVLAPAHAKRARDSD